MNGYYEKVIKALRVHGYEKPHFISMQCIEMSDWRRRAESNRSRRICNPLHNRFATAPHATLI